jgi:predicted PurR-regulated permease PerM
MADLRDADWTFFRRLLVVALVIGLAYAVWQLAGILILLFAAVLVAILLTGLAQVIQEYTFVPQRWALTIVVLGLAFILVTFFILFGTKLGGQVVDVVSRVPQALDAAAQRFDVINASARVADSFSSQAGGQLFSRIASIGYTLIGVVADLVLVVVTAVYLAADPQLYRHGVEKLFPTQQHARIRGALDATTAALRLWFLGQLVSMALVGVLSATAYALIGLPSAIGLGAIAGVMNFVPLVGPIVGAVPAVLFASTQDVATVAWTVGAILVIQQIEGYVIMPFVQRRAVDVPPAVVLFAIAGFGVLFGWLGVLFAVPLAVVAMVIVQKFWIRQTLGEETTVPGEPASQ